MDVKFYTVTDAYIDYLHSFDKRVQKHKDDGYPKPYVGIIMSMGGFNYFVPLSSPKSKHATMKENITFIKILDGQDLKAVINVNNMVPVPDSEYELLKFEDYKQEHQDLLNKEYNEVKRIATKIIRNATNLYRMVTVQPDENSGYVKLCCDFKMLEQKSQEYKQPQKQAN
ncbi:hypothetical protein D3C71_1529820 [compost metagenome]